MARLELRGLTVAYGKTTAVRELDLTVDDGEMIALLGPSGAGKTSILRAVAGLIRPAAGTVKLGGRDVTHLPPERRDVVMVFQKPLLFPFMNVEQNVAFGLKAQGAAGSGQAVAAMLERVGLTGLARRRVHELSGGQQQRVSLARALVLKPSLLLLDEPFSNLDPELRSLMRELVGQLQAELNLTTVFVTHDQAEALMISHRAALILDGRLRQCAPPPALFRRPCDRETAAFFGAANFITGELADGILHSRLGPLAVAGDHPRGARTAVIRPEDVVLKRPGEAALTGVVTRTRFEGPAVRVWIDCHGVELIASGPDHEPQPGDEVSVDLPAEKIWLLPEDPP